MATNFKNLWVNWEEKRLQQSDLNGGDFVLPDFMKYEEVPFRVRILERDPAGVPEGWAIVSVAPFTLAITINDTLDDASPLADQQVWVPDTTLNKFEGVLQLNTPAMNAYVGSAISVNAYFQITLSQGGGQPTPIYQRPIKILNSVNQPTTTSPDVTKVYRTADESDLVYLTAIGKPGQFRAELSPSGNYARYTGVDDGGAPIDLILPYPPTP